MSTRAPTGLGPSGHVVQLPVTTQEWDYLVALTKTGLYGATALEVLRSLMLIGIRDAAEREFIETTGADNG